MSDTPKTYALPLEHMRLLADAVSTLDALAAARRRTDVGTEVEQRRQMIEDAHDVIIAALGSDVKLVYAVDDPETA